MILKEQHHDRDCLSICTHLDQWMNERQCVRTHRHTQTHTHTHSNTTCRVTALTDTRVFNSTVWDVFWAALMYLWMDQCVSADPLLWSLKCVWRWWMFPWMGLSVRTDVVSGQKERSEAVKCVCVCVCVWSYTADWRRCCWSRTIVKTDQNTKSPKQSAAERVKYRTREPGFIYQLEHVISCSLVAIWFSLGN